MIDTISIIMNNTELDFCFTLVLLWVQWNCAPLKFDFMRSQNRFSPTGPKKLKNKYCSSTTLKMNLDTPKPSVFIILYHLKKN